MACCLEAHSYFMNQWWYQCGHLTFTRRQFRRKCSRSILGMNSQIKHLRSQLYLQEANKLISTRPCHRHKLHQQVSTFTTVPVNPRIWVQKWHMSQLICKHFKTKTRLMVLEYDSALGFNNYSWITITKRRKALICYSGCHMFYISTLVNMFT